MRRRIPALLALAVLISCDSETLIIAPRAVGPSAAILDGSREGGNPGFHFQPPIVQRIYRPTGEFARELYEFLTVEVCEWSGSACVGAPIRTFTSAASGPSRLHRLDVLKTYVAFWNTRADNLNPEKLYRISVKAGPVELGFADVNILRRLRDARDVNRDEFVALPDDWTLPIAFTVEEGAAGREVFSIDPANMSLVGTPEERAQGLFVFQRHGGGPLPTAGQVLVGVESGGFVRLVEAVETSGDRVLVTTQFASLSDFVTSGSFNTSLSLAGSADLQTQGASLAPGQDSILIGESRAVYLADGVSGGPALVSIGGVDLCEDLLNGTCPPGVEISLPAGEITFEPQIELSAEFGFLELERFRATVTGALRYDVELGVEAAATFEVSGERRIAQFVRPFLIPPSPTLPVPVAGEIVLDILAGVEASAGAEARYTAGFTSLHSATAGAEYEEGEWSSIVSFDHSATSTAPSFSGLAEAQARAYVRPEVTILLYGVAGPVIGIEPALTAVARIGVEDSSPFCEFVATGNIHAVIGFVVAVLDDEVGRFDETFEGPEWLREEASCELRGDLGGTVASPQRGPLAGVTVTASTVEDEFSATTEAPFGSFTLLGLPGGPATVTLGNLPDGCEPPAPVDVVVLPGEMTSFDLSVSCPPTDHPEVPEPFASDSVSVSNLTARKTIAAGALFVMFSSGNVSYQSTSYGRPDTSVLIRSSFDGALDAGEILCSRSGSNGHFFVVGTSRRERIDASPPHAVTSRDMFPVDRFSFGFRPTAYDADDCPISGSFFPVTARFLSPDPSAPIERILSPTVSWVFLP